jgi:polyferredoxin
MRVYSKKRFMIGIIFLLLFLVSVFLLVPDIINENKDIIIIINRIFIMLLMLFCSLGSLLTSLNKDENKRAEREERDERNELVELKSGSMVSKILFYLFIFFEVLFILLWYKFNIDTLLIPVIIFGFLITITFVLDIVTVIYYEKKI